MSEHQTGGDMVLVAHDVESRALEAARLVREAGTRVIVVADGDSALEVLRGMKPRVLIVGVGLRKPPFYELCEIIAAEDLGTRVVLVSSVHTKGAYKRAPTNLYGADASVEEHKLASELLPLLARLQKPS